MLGCFGVAPPLAQAISTATSGTYGGNMDYRRFGPGTTAYFPVFAPGALFFLGDGHFAQGDGEIVGTGIETSFEVEFTVSLRKGRTIGWPRGETAQHVFALGNARPLDQALQHATTEMIAWLAADYGLDAARGEPPARPGGALRRRQCVQPRLFRRLPAGQAHARRACRMNARTAPPEPMESRLVAIAAEHVRRFGAPRAHRRRRRGARRA